MRDPERPPWLRKRDTRTPEVIALKAKIAHLGLSTVCESARCPNLSECYQAGSATFLILGSRCTRNCAFCAVDSGVPQPPDPEEGKKIAAYVARAEVLYAVITSVTRDDLPDGGAGQFEIVVRAIREAFPPIGLELLVPDFKGSLGSIDRMLDLPIHVFAHNIETVSSLYSTARRGADYARSLSVLRRAADRKPRSLIVKSGVMVGLGETKEELEQLFKDLAASGVQALTVGQYLRPSRRNIPVARYLAPEEFDSLAETARSCGIPSVLAGPYVRSSYMAEALHENSLSSAVHEADGRSAEGKKFDKD